MAKTEAAKKAVKKWNKEHYDKITLRVRKEQTQEIKEHAQKTGESVNSFIIRAIKSQMAQDASTILNEKPRTPEEVVAALGKVFSRKPKPDPDVYYPLPWETQS